VVVVLPGHRHVRFAATLAAALVVFASSPPTRRAYRLRLGWAILTGSDKPDTMDRDGLEATKEAI
jgi:hypothetical protein